MDVDHLPAQEDTSSLAAPATLVTTINHASAQSITGIGRLESTMANNDPVVSPDDIIREFTLNKEQARAFNIIARHRLESSENAVNEPLRMYIGGQGGTGKSRVINALTAFFERRNESKKLKLCAFMGVAARNISGSTLHASLSLYQRGQGGLSTQGKRHLQNVWEGVDYLFIDEVSMVSCELLFDVHEALMDAKGNSRPFGGLNIIFAGDFAQLPPVGQTSLYANVNAAYTRGTSKSEILHQKRVMGRLLWLSVKTAVILSVLMRQTGAENQRFSELLARLRLGVCNQSDFELLKTRVGKNAHIDWSLPGWSDTPLLVYGNESKDKFNLKAVSTYTTRNKQKAHDYYAVDKLAGRTIENTELQDTLSEFHSGQTSQRLPKLSLAIGMRVIVCQNFDVPGGVVNGTVGILKKIRYWVDDEGHRHATSCVIHAEDTSPTPLPGLPPHHVVALAEKVKIRFENKYTFKCCSIDRTQLPVLPAYAFTAHKSQGQTYEKVVVDLASCRGSAAPYVMLSRVKSLEGLCILRDFAIDKIRCHMNEDCRREMKRLERLDLQTLMSVGSAEERTYAANELKEKYSSAEREVISLPLTDETDSQCLQSGNARLDHFQRGLRQTGRNLPSAVAPAATTRSSRKRRRTGLNAEHLTSNLDSVLHPDVVRATTGSEPPNTPYSMLLFTFITRTCWIDFFFSRQYTHAGEINT